MSEPLELALGSRILRLDGTVIEVLNRDRIDSTMRIHVNHAAARIEHARDGSLKVSFGWPRSWVYGMPGGPGADLIDNNVDADGRGKFTLPPELEPTIRAFLAECAARRTRPLPGSDLP